MLQGEFDFIETVELGKISQGDYKNRRKELIAVYGFHDSFLVYMKVIFIRGRIECLLCAGAVLVTVDEEIRQTYLP